MRIVLDTNVIVSALLVQGSVPGRVLETVIGGLSRTLVDGRIMREYRTVLARPEFAFPEDHVADLLALLERSEWIVADPLLLDLHDATDLPFLEVAISGGADAIVTGNSADFRLRKGRLDIPVLTPRQYLDHLAGREPR
jgi:uncharacterized protein